MKTNYAHSIAGLVFDLCLVIGLWLALVCALSGCSLGPARLVREPIANSTAGRVNVEQRGDAATPATAAETSVTTSATVPPGVTVTAHADGSLSWVNAAPLSVVTTKTTASATGPAAFTPPAPPTPSDEADGEARLYAWLAIGAGVAGGLFGVLRGWPSVGVGGACVAAAGVGVLAAGKIPAWVYTVAAVGVALAAFGGLLWHCYLKPQTGRPILNDGFEPPSPTPSPAP